MKQNESIRMRLEAIAEPGYAAFSARLLPMVKPARILGVRLPALREMARELARGDWMAYLEQARTDSFEETMLQGLTIGYLKAPAEKVLPWIAAFVPKIDNWSVCDSTCAGLKLARREPDVVWEFLIPYLQEKREYFVRFGVVMLLDHYIDEKHLESVLTLLNAADCRGSAASTAVAWALSVCYVRFPQETLSYLEACTLDDITYNRALQKIVESNRVDAKVKPILRAMRRRS